MKTRISWALALVVLVTLTVPGGVLAQSPVTPPVSDPYWTASYWNNIDLAGQPVLTREEETINYNWGTGSPDPSVQPDDFSARWTRYVDFTGGTYRFIVTSDDGVRLWVDDSLIVDQWNDHAEETFYADFTLSEGTHLIWMEYYEDQGLAVARLSWVPTEQGVGQWRGEYFTNALLEGTPTLVRYDPEINFNWGTGSPDPGIIPDDRFSVRWTRTIDLPPGNYTFNVVTDDGARLWINGQLFIDAWFVQSATHYYQDIYLSGPTTFELDYFEDTGLSVIQLYWIPETQGTIPQQIVVVDDQDPGFVKGGIARNWREASTGYNGHMFWTYNNELPQTGYDWAQWHPALAPGRYEVQVYVPAQFSTTMQARYWVAHRGGLSLQIVDQVADGGQWVSLGVFDFNGDGSEYVSLADVTFEPSLSTQVAFDAVRWIPSP